MLVWMRQDPSSAGAATDTDGPADPADSSAPLDTADTGTSPVAAGQLAARLSPLVDMDAL